MNNKDAEANKLPYYRGMNPELSRIANEYLEQHYLKRCSRCKMRENKL